MQENKGITLIALVITIIVLLILAGVTIAMLSGENGILSRAQETKFQNDYFSAEERARLAYMTVKTEIMANRASNGTYDATETTNANALKELVAKDLTGDGWGTPTVENSAIKVTYTNASIKANGISEGKPKYNGKVEFSIGLTAKDATLSVDGVEVSGTTSGGGSDSGDSGQGGSGSGGNSSTLPSGTYTAGQEVTFGGEQFFVLEDQGSTVTLLAKYCLKRDGSVQTDKDATYNGSGDAGYGRSFSSTNYWSSDFTSSPFDLQGDYLANHPLSSNETVANNAIKAAQSYGTTKGVTGRLMTYDEANGIKTSGTDAMKKILWGKWTDGTQPTQGYLFFWLGAVNYSYYLWYVGGTNSDLYYYHYYGDALGVRPVLVVSES